MSQLKQSGHALGAIGLGGAGATVLFFYWKLNYPESYAEIDEVTRGAINWIVIFAVTRVWSLVALLSSMLGLSNKPPSSGGFALPAVLATLLVAACLVVGGCVSSGGKDPARTAFVSAAETTAMLYEASAQAYASCHAKADSRAEQNDCFAEKQYRGERIHQAQPHLEAFGTGLITAEAVASNDDLQRAQAILQTVYAVLFSYLDTSERRQLAWLEDEGGAL